MKKETDTNRINKYKEFYEFYNRNPTIFVEEVLNTKLRTYQKCWLKIICSNKIPRKGLYRYFRAKGGISEWIFKS